MNILNRYHSGVWLDRFNVRLSQKWDMELWETRTEMSHAIVILSDNYLNSKYCRDEYEYYLRNDITIIAIVAEDLTILDLLADIRLDDWIDFRNWRDASKIKASIDRVLERLPSQRTRTKQTERTNYLQTLIAGIELELLQLPTTRVSYLSHQGNLYKSHAIRPRGYDINLLTQWHFSYQEDGRELEVANILSWFDVQPRFALSGKSGSGKTTIAHLLALWNAHEGLYNDNIALPIWIDLALWTETQSFEQFIESQWPLAFYWKHWLDSNQALLIFDHWSDFHLLNPDRVDELLHWIDVSSNHNIVILTQDTSTIPLDIPILNINAIPDHEVKRFANLFLQDKPKEIFQNLLAKHKGKILHRHIDYVSYGIELVELDSTVAVESWHVDPVSSLIGLRWDHNAQGLQAQCSQEQFLEDMKTLAWQMFQQEQYRFVSRSDAEEIVKKKIHIQLAVDLGLMDIIGDLLRFQTEMTQWYLAANCLAHDGLYKHLSSPTFTSSGQRESSKWDDVVLALIDIVPDDQKRRTLDQVAEIDPFLAYMCMERHPTLQKTYLMPILQKLIDLRSKNPTAHPALTKVLHKIPFIEETTTLLLAQLPHYDWSIQLWLWEAILSLPLEIPSEFINRVRRLDRDFEESVFDLLSEFPLPASFAYLAHLIQHRAPEIQLNAIWLAGELKHTASQVGLYLLLDNVTVDVRQEALSALAKIPDDDLIKRLLMWLPKFPEHAGDVGDVLCGGDKPVSCTLLKELHENQLLVDDALRNAIMKHTEADIAIAVAQIVATETDSPEILDEIAVDGGNIMKVHRLLQSGMLQLPRMSLNRLLDAVTRYLGIQIFSSQNANETLYERAQLAVSSANTDTVDNTAVNDISEELNNQLNSDDSLVRRTAIEKLSTYRAEVALPLLLVLVNDPDTQVRIVALYQLAQFIDHDEARQTLISALADDDYQVIETATDILKAVNITETAELYDLLKADHVDTIAGVIDVLGHSRYEDAVIEIIPFLDDERKVSNSDKTLGDFATESLVAIGTPDALDSVAQVDNADPIDVDTEVVSMPAQSVKDDTEKSYSNLEKVRYSINALQGEDWGLAQKAARYLPRFAKRLQGSEDQAIVELLCETFSDPNWHVRWAVGEALAWLRNPAAIPYFVQRLNDDNWMVQVTAIRGLVELDASDYAPDIAKYLNHPNHAVREAVAEALGALKNPVVVPKLDLILDSDDDFLRLAAIQAIYQIGGEYVADYLYKALNDDYVHLRWFAMKHLVPYVGSYDAQLLAQLLVDTGKPPWEDKAISDYALEALTLIDTPKSRAIIDKWNKLKKRKMV